MTASKKKRLPPQPERYAHEAVDWVSNKVVGKTSAEVTDATDVQWERFFRWLTDGLYNLPRVLANPQLATIHGDVLRLLTTAKEVQDSMSARVSARGAERRLEELFGRLAAGAALPRKEKHDDKDLN